MTSVLTFPRGTDSVDSDDADPVADLNIVQAIEVTANVHGRYSGVSVRLERWDRNEAGTLDLRIIAHGDDARTDTGGDAVTFMLKPGGLPLLRVFARVFSALAEQAEDDPRFAPPPAADPRFTPPAADDGF